MHADHTGSKNRLAEVILNLLNTREERETSLRCYTEWMNNGNNNYSLQHEKLKYRSIRFRFNKQGFLF